MYDCWILIGPWGVWAVCNVGFCVLQTLNLLWTRTILQIAFGRILGQSHNTFVVSYFYSQCVSVHRYSLIFARTCFFELLENHFVVQGLLCCHKSWEPPYCRKGLFFTGSGSCNCRTQWYENPGTCT